ncbi:MAG: DUF4276 family protein, partial [Candidatus Cloacimonetes bacterium]|nr:DUF4276 family protein [Candidatus Cloacimonadota bacterium]
MKNVIIVCEGKTESVFVKNVLTPYVQNHSVGAVIPITISTATTSYKSFKGGALSYQRLINGIINFLKDKNNIVTTMIDMYGLSTDFPKYKD